MKLYYFPLSSNARRAVMTAKLLKAPVELVLLNLAEGAHKKPDYLALNPNGKVPTLVDPGASPSGDGDFVLWESWAIMKYLCEKTPGNTLYPTELRARTDVDRWMFWAAAHFTPAIATLNYENMLKKMFGWGEPNPAFIEKAEADLKTFAAVLDKHLEGRTWICGNGISLADVAIACPLMSTVPAKLPVTGFSHLQAWFARVQALDAWKETNPPPPPGR